MNKVQKLAANELLCDVLPRPDGSVTRIFKNDISLALNLEAMNCSKEVFDQLTKSCRIQDTAGLSPADVSKVDNVFEAVNLLETRFVQSPSDKVKALNILKQRVDLETAKIADAEKRAALQTKYDEFMSKLS